MARILPASAIGLALLIMLVAPARPQAATGEEVKELFGKFIAAQNAHDLKSVADILQDSPDFLWITRGAPVWGRDAALKQFEEYYRGTWQLEPKLDELRVTEVAPGFARLFVPAIFTIAPAGQTAQPRRFLLTQLYVRTGDGWKLSTILPLPVP